MKYGRSVDYRLYFCPRCDCKRRFFWYDEYSSGGEKSPSYYCGRCDLSTDQIYIDRRAREKSLLGEPR